MVSFHRPLLGAHVSASGGLYKAIENADAIGAECIQIFGASPRQWHASDPRPQDIERFVKLRNERGIGAVFLHAAYLVNLGAPLKSSYNKSVKNLAAHLRIAQLIGAEGLIFHIGTAKGNTREKALKQCVEGMREVIAAVPPRAARAAGATTTTTAPRTTAHPGTPYLIMENAAGGGEKIGTTAAELGALLRAAKSNRIKVCFDTAHAFEGGAIESYTPTVIKKTFDEWDKHVGCENIVALHINDSKTPYNSRNDRHENLGDGYIGRNGFIALARERRLHHAAWILEVPGLDGNGPDEHNMDILKSCFAK